jgi:nitrate reductase cytochrome c-type subunit
MCHKNAVAKDRKAGEIPLTHLKDGKITGLA